MNLENLKVADLRNELKNRGLSTSGNKAQLMDRLSEVLALQPPANLGVVAGLNQSLDEVDLSLENLLNETPPTLAALNPSSATFAIASASASVPVSAPLVSSTHLGSVPAPISSTKISTKPKVMISARAKPPSALAPVKVTEASVATSSGDSAVPVKAGLSDAERLALRAQKFGAASAVATGSTDKKQERAARFGLASSSSDAGAATKSNKIVADTPTDPEKLKQRAARFGTCVSDSLKKLDLQERIKQRAERFGKTASPPTGDPTLAVLKSIKRTAPLATETDSRKHARLARFGAV